MPSTAAVPGGFLVCPPLDLPLRLRNEWGNVSFHALQPAAAFGLLPTDHFAVLNPLGTPEFHRIHEGVDLESGIGNPVYSAYAGQVVSLDQTEILVNHHEDGSGFATRYIHVEPLPTLSVNDRVLKGQPIATVMDFVSAGPHLHFELWHWINATANNRTDSLAVSIDPTRMLERWEGIHAIDYQVLGNVAADIGPVLDGGQWHGALFHAYRAARLPSFERPDIEVIAPGAVWRISEGDRSHLLRIEDPTITVFDESYGAKTIVLDRIERIGVMPRRKYPTLVVGGDGEDRYAVPLHDAGIVDEQKASMLRLAHEQGAPVELQVRRSPFWSMDGSVDEIVGLIDGVTVLR